MELFKIITNLNESKIGSHKVQLAMNKMISYLQRKIGASLIKVPGNEYFQNADGKLVGHRYVIGGTTDCVRFNWKNVGDAGKTMEIVSIDVFKGRRTPKISITTSGISFVQSLPRVADLISDPRLGDYKVFPVNPTEAINESLTEATRDQYSTDAAVSDFLKKVTSGTTFTRSEFIGAYHIVNVGIFDVVMDELRDKFNIDGRRVSASSNLNVNDVKSLILKHVGTVNVSHGKPEKYLKTKQEEEIDDNEVHVPYEDALGHLRELVSAVLAGASNALFVTGRGGTGKTQTVEDVLSHRGLEDGSGYFKNTGTTSAIGLYVTLYKNRDGIVLFDDCDGVFADQDSRNLLKAATDTKKVRKLAWTKKSSYTYDADETSESDSEDPEKAPRTFDFKGRILFISNLSLSKLDPDEALRTRGFIINIDPTDDEMLKYMEKILFKINLEDGLTLSSAQRHKVFATVKGAQSKQRVTLRKLVRALNLAATGVGNWEELVKLYC